MLSFLFHPFAWLADVTFSGLGHALWTSIWQWGLGVFLIIVFAAAAYLAPVGKTYFLGAAILVAIVLVIFGWGQHTEKTICDARVKYIYLRSHPNVNPKTAAVQWNRKKVIAKPSASNGVTNSTGLPCVVFGGC